MFFYKWYVDRKRCLTIEQKTSTNLELRLDTSELGYNKYHKMR